MYSVIPVNFNTSTSQLVLHVTTFVTIHKYGLALNTAVFSLKPSFKPNLV